KSLNANMSFDALLQMRLESPTGGALGSITEGELDLLRSRIASLDPFGHREKFLGDVKFIRSEIQRMTQEVVNSSASEADKQRALRLFGGGPTQDSGTPSPKSKEEYDALAPGALYIDPKGQPR